MSLFLYVHLTIYVVSDSKSVHLVYLQAPIVTIDDWRYLTDVSERDLKYAVSQQPVCAIVGANGVFMVYKTV